MEGVGGWVGGGGDGVKSIPGPPGVKEYKEYGNQKVVVWLLASSEPTEESSSCKVASILLRAARAPSYFLFGLISTKWFSSTRKDQRLSLGHLVLNHAGTYN